MARVYADLVIDLHGFFGDQARIRIRNILEDRRNIGKSILFIHGCGQGVLRDAVREIAHDSALVKDIWPGEERFLDGGAGVTLLFL